MNYSFLLFQAGVLLDSYETISRVALSVAIAQRHNNSRLPDPPSANPGELLCSMKRLMVGTDSRLLVTAHSLTLAALDVDRIVPFTCQTLRDAVVLLRKVKVDILETFYSRWK